MIVIRNNVERIIDDNELEKFKNKGFKEINVSSVDKKVPEASKKPLSKMKVDELKELAAELGLEADGLTADELRKVIKDNQ